MALLLNASSVVFISKVFTNYLHFLFSTTNYSNKDIRTWKNQIICITQIPFLASPCISSKKVSTSLNHSISVCESEQYFLPSRPASFTDCTFLSDSWNFLYICLPVFCLIFLFKDNYSRCCQILDIEASLQDVCLVQDNFSSRLLTPCSIPIPFFFPLSLVLLQDPS